jgi:hypothetical protein
VSERWTHGAHRACAASHPGSVHGALDAPEQLRDIVMTVMTRIDVPLSLLLFMIIIMMMMLMMMMMMMMMNVVAVMVMMITMYAS